MPSANKLPKYALYDFDDGTVATGLSCLIDIASADVSDHNFDYKESHIVFWPNRPPQNSSEEDILKLKQCAKILLFNNDLSIVKQYRDQLSDDIVSVELFPKIRTKQWEKSTAVVGNSCAPYPGGAARQSRRLKAKIKPCDAPEEEEHDEHQAKKNSSNPTVLMPKQPPKNKKAREALNNTTTLEKIAKQKDLLLSKTQKDKPDSQPTISSVTENPVPFCEV